LNSKQSRKENPSSGVRYIISINAGCLQYKTACHDSKTDPWMCPYVHFNCVWLTDQRNDRKVQYRL